MARLTLGILGPVHGRVGNLVFYVINGVNFVRSRPRKSDKAASTRQIIQRHKFGMATHFASHLAELINESYHLINRKRKGMQVLIKEILSEGIIGEYPNLEIDFSGYSF